MKYKINQLVKVKNTGFVGGVSKVDDCDETYEVSNSDWYTESGIEPATPYQVGDILVDKGGMERKVLDVFPNTLVLSECDDFDDIFDLYTYSKIEKYGYKLKDSEEEDLTELTLEEVAKKFKIDVNKLRIKESA